MKRSMYLAAVVMLVFSSTGLRAQAPKTESFVGTIKALSGSSVTVERGTISGIFTVDSKTHVSAKGSTAKTKEAQAAGKPGLTIADAFHVGDQVQVKYQESGNKMVATDIALVASIAGK